MRGLEFEPKAEEQFLDWEKLDKKIFDKIGDLIDNILQQPYKGMGKPEALKHNLKGCWSRRINKEHRLVYKVTKTSIIIISCKFHY